MTVEHIVGIDLGTTNSEIAVIEDGRPVVVPIEGEMVMPSCVGVDNEGEVIVGRVARNQMAVRPEATVLSIKRRMGEDVRVDLGDKRLTPEEISALILKKLKAHAEDYLGENVSKAVITVPAYFDDSQRKATKQAGMLAGLEVLRIINEPTAAALAYEAGREENMKILVYDLGGGTFDVSLVFVENGVVEVKASHGDTHLGGDDFDRLLIDHVMKEFKGRHGIDLSADGRSWNRVWAAVERAKRVLSDQPYARIKEEFISGDHHLDMEISRAEYEEMIRPLLRKTIDCVHRCLKDAAFLPRTIDKIVLVGGATRTPLAAEMLLDEIGIEPRNEVNPELIVAMGAAIQGGVIAGRETQSVLVDITPYTFGTSVVALYGGELREDVFAPIIRRNTALPVSKGEVFQTMFDGQEAVDVRIYQGEEPIAEDNIFIGRFLVEGLSDVPAGNEIVLNLQLNLDGILDVTAVEKRTGLSKTVRMDTGNGKQRFGLEPARADLSEVSEELKQEGASVPPSARTGNDRQRLVGEAKRLRLRAESLLEEVDETDAQEIRSLIEESKGAIGAGDLDKLSGLNESLSDMLFYLED